MLTLRLFLRPCLLALLLLPATAMPAQPLAGTASVTDGDTLEIHGQRIRLHGIDAPESGQLCHRNGEPWRCGQTAALALSDFIGRRVVSCEPRDKDRYGRIVAVCSVGGTNINRWLVAEGHALAYRQYSMDYVRDETAAKTARKGVWNSTFDPPWEWRKGRRTKHATPSAPVSPSTTSARTSAAQCGTKRTCREMTSCAEAKDFLTRCGVKSLDGDHDGVPCEALCR